MKKITIAIDGGAGTGKGTTAKGVASMLGYAYVDTGAMYRAATIRLREENLLYASDEEIQCKIEQLVISFGHGVQEGQVFLDGRDITQEIRSPEVNEHVARISTHECIRNHLRVQQRELAKQGGVVMDGRDMGSVVVPDAELKVFLHCSFDERAKRRQAEMLEKGIQLPLEMVKKNLQERDEIDYTGDTPTSRKASDARELDTTNLAIDEQIAIVFNWAKEEINKRT